MNKKGKYARNIKHVHLKETHKTISKNLVFKNHFRSNWLRLGNLSYMYKPEKTIFYYITYDKGINNTFENPHQVISLRKIHFIFAFKLFYVHVMNFSICSSYVVM